MLSVLRNWLQRDERERERKLDLIERENNFLDHELSEEQQQQQQKGDSSCMQNIIKSKQEMDNSTWQEADDKSCSSRQGVITELHSKGGVIDTYIPFDGPASDHIYHQLVKGSVVEYLAYKKANEEFLKVVKILKVIEQGWGESITDSTITAAVESLKLEDSTYFKTQERIVHGMVIERLQSTIEVDTSSGRQKFDLENVELTFVPKMGDYVTLECAVQLDDGYVDKQGEILQLLKVFPTRILSNEKYRVERCFPEFAVLGENAYLLRENFPSGTELHMGDYVLADLIECVYSKFTYRAIKVMPQESNFLSMKKEKTFSGDRHVIITGATRFITTELWEKHKITLKLQNNSNRKLELHEVQLDHGHASQIRVIEPLTKTCLGIEGQLSVILEVEARCIGEWAEKYTLDFMKFKVVRCFKIIACETQKEADDAERRLLAAESFVVSGRSEAQRNRSYAKNVWANTLDVVRGESGLCRQRFVLTRIGNFDVPESLRNVYLRDCRPTEVLDDLERLYPCSTEALCMANYVQRFRFFLHLEEIEFFVCIRNFDRDRAHMERDGEYLSLTIENLAERRPSLVIGDTVCAINPWKDVTSDNKSYSGCIHKVLFDRVLLKFHPNFQEKYNGEDYRLEFYFSRFSLRKQHHAISQVVTSLGEQFLFPSKVTKRPHPQLHVRLVDGEDMYLFDTKLEWYNKSLNNIQKRAVFNILRGEAMNLPYVIFGPPGTGKTVTLVEAVLQMVRNLQSCRILVATPSNSAADLITRRIIASNALSPGDFVRIVSHNLIEKELIPTELMPYCATLDVGIDGSSEDNMLVTESGLKLRCKWKFMGGHRVSIGTCATLGNFMQMSFPGGHFTHLFLDEAGQSTEPEALMPAALLSKDRGQVILSGDPHQLQPIILSKYGRNCGFDLSLLERLLATQPYAKDLVGYPESSGYNPLVLTKLLHNYRALPSIMATYSKLFYDDELISMVSEENSRERTLLGRVQPVLGTGMPHNHGVCFVGIMGQNMQDRDSPSWYNPLEAREVYLMVISLYRCAVTPDQIGILTPYSKQVKTIRGLFMGTNVAMPKVGSAEEFQGQERDIMLISTVRSSETLLVKDAHLSLGFVRCRKRLNVAISRARAFLVVYGNPHLLSVDDNWRHLITFCANNNAYFGCELPQSFVPDESDGEADDSSDSYHEVSDSSLY